MAVVIVAKYCNVKVMPLLDVTLSCGNVIPALTTQNILYSTSIFAMHDDKVILDTTTAADTATMATRKYYLTTDFAAYLTLNRSYVFLQKSGNATQIVNRSRVKCSVQNRDLSPRGMPVVKEELILCTLR